MSLDVSIRLLAFQVRSHMFLKHITITLNKMKVYFNQGFLDIYLEKLEGEKIQNFSKLVSLFHERKYFFYWNQPYITLESSKIIIIFTVRKGI